MRGLKVGAVLSFIISMTVLLLGGYFAVDKVAPYPEKVVVEGKIVATAESIMSGQNVYQKYGLMDHGSIWGHGSLRGMDFSATTLHLIGEYMRDYYSEEKGKQYRNLLLSEKSEIDGKVIREIKENKYNPVSKTLMLSQAEAYTLVKIKKYWKDLFRKGDREYGFFPETVKFEEERENIADFFFWTAWAASTNRPGENFTYTNNWPNDRSVGNTMSSDAFIWSVFSILAFFIVLGLVIYIIHRYKILYGEPKGVELGKELINLDLTKSQFRAAKFFLVVMLFFIMQMLMGGLLAQYTIQPRYFCIACISDFISYSWAKTWHLQLAIFWITTSWIGASIYLAPLIGSKEPKGQGTLVNILFISIVIVAFGSLFGEVLGIKGMLGDKWFWFGHQGWEYLELGRIWQILLFIGLISWFIIVYRALKDKLIGSNKDKSGIVLFYTFSTVLVVAFFGCGLFYGRETHITIVDFWRWFVVHLWVEGVFELFGVAVIALFLTTLGLVSKKSAVKVGYLTAILVFSSSIMGTAHHYFWYGGPSYWLALGSVFSSLEIIPLILLVTRAWMEYKSVNDAGIDFPYRWPLFFLIASSFWNFLGAGVFGFIINLPIINYYEHGTYLTSNHAHTALFGVYGMLSISLLLFTWRSLVKDEYWDDRIIKLSFWGLNGGLFLMFLITLLPIGIAQTLASYRDGFWFARSSEFYNGNLVQILGQIRAIPDLIMILLGALPLFIFLKKTYPKLKQIGFKEEEKIYKERDSIF